MPSFLPSYEKCKYSLFVSYAFDDDKASLNWISAVKDLIDAKLHRLGKNVKLAYLAGKDPLSQGYVEDELAEEIKQSFAMLIVAGDCYLESGWCDVELQIFTKLYGVEGISKRLFIVAMSKKAFVGAQNKIDAWNRHNGLPANKKIVVVPMYQEGDSTEPIPARINEEIFNPEFSENLKGISKRLIERIQASMGSASVAGATDTIDRARTLRVAIAPCSSNLSQHAQSLEKRLKGAGLEAACLADGLIPEHDPETVDEGLSLRMELEKYDVLIAPITFGKPSRRPAIPGGHVKMLEEEWAKLKRDTGIIWYRPMAEMDEGVRASATHLQVLENLSPIWRSEEDVVSGLLGAKSEDAIKVYVECHPKRSNEYYRLINKLEETWEALPRPDNCPRLICRRLHLTELEQVERNGTAVVLQLLTDEKAGRSLRSQWFKVERHYQSVFTPGLVAVIYKTDDRPLGEGPWTSVEFVRESGVSFFADDENEKEMSEFLQNLIRRYPKKAPDTPTPGALQ